MTNTKKRETAPKEEYFQNQVKTKAEEVVQSVLVNWLQISLVHGYSVTRWVKRRLPVQCRTRSATADSIRKKGELVTRKGAGDEQEC